MNSETKTYRFILTPLDTIFFGGEKSPFKEEYFRKSNFFPQQTTVLGFLRYEVLKRANLIGAFADKKLWEPYIGKSSWNGTEQTFGLIEKIGPVSVFCKNEKNDLFTSRNPCGMELQTTTIDCCYGEESGQTNTAAFFAKDTFRYNVKNHSHFKEILTDFAGFDRYFECENDNNFYEKYGVKRPETSKGVFFKDIQPGITKNYEGETKDEGYFKTLYWRMADGYAYGFKATIKADEKISDWKGKSIVIFGGETSKYLLEVEKEGMDTPPPVDDIVVLTSDAYLSNDIYRFCDFAIADSLNFRNLKTTVNDTKFSKRPVLKWYRREEGDGRNTEPARILMKKGSILFVKDKDNFRKLITNPVFQNIGYNYFKSFKTLYQPA